MKKHMFTKTIRSRLAFTLAEMMVSMGVFSLVLGGTAPVFVMCVRSWQLTSVQVQAAQKSSFAMERMVYGVGLSYGLRSAVASSVSAGPTTNGWRISYTDVVGNSNVFTYLAGADRLTYDGPSVSGEVTVGDCISAAVYSNSPAGMYFRLTSLVGDGRWSASNTVATFIAYRN